MRAGAGPRLARRRPPKPIVSPVTRILHPKTTVRWRLTLLYGGLILASGAALLAITYTLVDHATLTGGPFAQVTAAPQRAFPRSATFNSGAAGKAPRSGPNFTTTKSIPLPGAIRNVLKSSAGAAAIRIVGSDQRISDLHQLVIESSIALAIMALLSGGLGWVIAGRVLRPLRTITAATQQISEASLHRRLALHGPQDELRQLADTIDGLLSRLEAAFDAQKRFVANASHELRTPLTSARALLEMALYDPDATLETYRETCVQVLEENEHQEQLIDALLTLAQSQRGVNLHEPLDLARVTGAVLLAYGTEAAVHGVDVEAALDPAPIAGDPRLIERLTANLLQNAIRHNVTNGYVRLHVGIEAGETVLEIANSGPRIAPSEIERLLQPFQRLAPDRVSHQDGLGLGLSIITAIVAAHRGTIEFEPLDGGGLSVAVRFPAGAPRGAVLSAA
jgi:signal transduction histidine kinase